jgi:hypothetical protein
VGGGGILDVGLYSVGVSETEAEVEAPVGTLDVYAMGSIWVSTDEVLRRRDAMQK